MLDYRHCTLCPRACGVDRAAGERGFCQMPDHILAARAALHYWEEPVISGSFGSGAVFFSGCTLRCAFCQNGVISQENFGKELSTKELRAAFERLIDEGCQNINLVTPTHFLPSILPALTPRLPVPVIYNCGGYESVETLRELEKELRRCRPREIVRPVVLPHEEAESQQDERRKRARKEVEDSVEYTEYLKKLCKNVGTDDLFGFVVNPLVV